MRISSLLRSLASFGLAIAATSGLAGSAQAQWAPGGIPVAPGAGSGQQFAIPARDGQGGLYVAFRDRRSGDGDVYLQRLTADGYFSPGWLPTGLLVATGPTNQSPLIASPDEAGGVIVSWVDAVYGGYDVRAQRIRPDGTIAPGWPSTGVVVAGGDGYQQPEAMLSDGQGGAFIAWIDRPAVGSNMAYLQHLGPTGEPAPGWPSSGQPVVTTPGSHGATRMVSDGSGGVIAITAELGGALPGTPEGQGTNHSAVRFLPTGEVAPGWPPEGVLLLRTLSAVEVREICSDGAGGAYFAWNDSRFSPDPSIPFYFDIYAQHVLADGRIDPRWPADGLPIAYGPKWLGAQYDFDIASDGEGGMFIAWQEGYIYSQRIRPDATRAPGWELGGNRVSSSREGENFPRTVSDDLGGFWALWQAQGDAWRYLRMGGDGQVAPGWSSEGTLLANPAFHPFAISDNEHGVFVAFEGDGEDGRVTSAQRIYGDVTTSTVPSLVSAEAQTGQVRLRWSVAEIALVGMRVERRTESAEWIALGAPTPISPRLLEYVDTGLAAGRYAYRLGFVENGTEQFTEPAWIEVPSAFTLTLAGFRPNPSSGNPTIAFSLPDDRPARLDVIDVKGRVVHSRDVGSLRGGAHVLPLASEAALPPGMYWIRLTHPERTLTTKGLVVR